MTDRLSRIVALIDGDDTAMRGFVLSHDHRGRGSHGTTWACSLNLEPGTPGFDPAPLIYEGFTPNEAIDKLLAVHDA